MFADLGEERVKSWGWLKIEANPFFHIFITTDSEYYGFIPWVHTAEKPICLALPAQCWRGNQPGRNTRRWGEAAGTFWGTKPLSLCIILFSSPPHILFSIRQNLQFLLLFQKHNIIPWKAATSAVLSSLRWLLSDSPLTSGVTYTDRCLLSLFHPVTLSRHGVRLSVCGCVQPKTGAADPRQERLLADQSDKPHFSRRVRRGRRHLDRQQGRGQGVDPRSSKSGRRQRPLQHEAVSDLSVLLSSVSSANTNMNTRSGVNICVSRPMSKGVRGYILFKRKKKILWTQQIPCSHVIHHIYFPPDMLRQGMGEPVSVDVFEVRRMRGKLI